MVIAVLVFRKVKGTCLIGEILQPKGLYLSWKEKVLKLVIQIYSEKKLTDLFKTRML